MDGDGEERKAMGGRSDNETEGGEGATFCFARVLGRRVFDLFQKPKGLTLKRDRDHAITLKEGASIPNTHPYPYYQKN